jgi:ubiquinone/menaquinone biosynthesis C-methylase UbiE
LRAELLGIYQCPYTGAPLQLASAEGNSHPEVWSGELVAESRRYPILEGIPHLICHEDEEPSDDEKRECAYYEAHSDSYDAVVDWIFESFFENEDDVRERMIDLLHLRPGACVLETGCGTCRDSERIARRLGSTGRLFLQDLSPRMLKLGRERMRAHAERSVVPQSEFFVGNAKRLPFPTGYFDSAFHFGGINLFSDQAAALAEMVRVVKVGGKVVVGDESLAPWLRRTQNGKILLNSNGLYAHETPIALLPENAREVRLQWIIGQAYYLIDFRVGEGPPPVDLDKPILGARGGTHRTRYLGRLEGVTPEAKELAGNAARHSGLSMHQWLDRAVREQARRESTGKPVK